MASFGFTRSLGKHYWWCYVHALFHGRRNTSLFRLGNDLIYHGAPEDTSYDKRSYPLFSVPFRLAYKLGHRLNLQMSHSNMAYLEAASFNQRTVGLPPLRRSERAGGRARITNLIRNARVT
jgi:hypothetical protein